MQNQQYLSRRELLRGGLVLAVDALATPSQAYADHAKYNRPALQPHQVASLGNTPIDKLRHHILYRYLHEKELSEACVATEHHTQKTHAEIRETCQPLELILYRTIMRDELFNGGQLYVKAVPVGKIETVNDKGLKRLKTVPGETFPFALDIVYNDGSGFQLWKIYNSGVKGDIGSPLAGPETSDKLTALLVDGRKVEYLLPVKNGFRLGYFTFKKDAIDQWGNSKNVTIHVSNFDENSLRLTFAPPKSGGFLREFRFPFGVPDSHLESKYGADVRFEKMNEQLRQMEKRHRQPSGKKLEPFYSWGNTAGGSYGFHGGPEIAKVNEKVTQFHEKGSILTRGINEHLIRYLISKGIISPRK